MSFAVGMLVGACVGLTLGAVMNPAEWVDKFIAWGEAERERDRKAKERRP